jgi:uncharacterized lipoprotein YajG
VKDARIARSRAATWARRVTILGLLLLTGCGSVELVPQYGTVPVPRFPAIDPAPRVPVEVHVADAREIRDPNLIRSLQRALETGLHSRGFKLDAGGSRLKGTIEHVFVGGDRHSGDESNSVEIWVRLAANSPGVSGSWEKSYRGTASNEETPASAACERAFANLLEQLVGDPQLMAALGADAVAH